MGFSSKAKRWLKAGQLLRQGMSGCAVASAVGLTPRSIRKLRRDPRLYDPELNAISRYAGRRSKIPAQKHDDVRLALLHRFSLSEHSISRARRIIREVSGIDYPIRTVYLLLKKLKAELPKGALAGHYNHTKHRCNGCGAMLVKRTCLLCMVREIQEGTKA